MKVLVTGASGYIGSALVPQLLEARHAVRVVTRNAARINTQPWGTAVEIISGDLGSAATCEQAVQGMDIVLHLAGLAHVGASAAQHERENFNNTKVLATMAQQAQVKVFVLLSSCKANYPAHSPYAYYKRASESHLLALNGNMQVVCLRPGIVYGAHMRNNLRSLLTLLSQRTLPVFISSTKVISMISLPDCCRAIVAAMLQPALQGRSWELTDGVRYTLRELVVQIRTRKGLALPLVNCPPWLLWLGLATLGLLPPWRQRGVGLNTFRALYSEHYAVEPVFASASGVQPVDTFYQLLGSQNVEKR